MSTVIPPHRPDPVNGPEPQLLADLDWCLAQPGAAPSGAVWRLDESDRQLDANLIRLPAGAGVAEHSEPELDVILLVVAGSGTIRTASGTIDLTPNTLIWLPRDSRRALSAGPDGLACLTVHRSRPALRIRLPEDPVLRRRLEEREDAAEHGGEAACQLSRVCRACGAMNASASAAACATCGEPIGG